MFLRVIRESNGLVQFDGDEPNANRDYFSGFSINTPEKRAEHLDGLTGEDRTLKSKKKVREWKKSGKRKRKKLGEITGVSNINAGHISSIMDVLHAKDEEEAPESIYSQQKVIDWEDTVNSKEDK